MMTPRAFAALLVSAFATASCGDGEHHSLTDPAVRAVGIPWASASTFTFGESTILTTGDGGNGNLLVAQQAPLAQAGTLQSLSFYVTTASGKLRLGVYDATGPGGGPGAKRAETAEITPVSGWNTAAVTAPVALPAATYWLAYLSNTNSLQFRSATNGSGKWYTVTYGALPATYSTAPTGGAYHWSFYGTLASDTTPNAAPTVATVAAASPSPVTGTATALSVLGADDGGETALTYTWAATGSPPGAVTFAPNGTNAAKTATATFTRAGSYTLQVTIRDALGSTVTSSVTVAVNQMLTSIVVAPASATVAPGGTQLFAATGRDQFAQPLTVAPAFTWAVSGGGTISTNGLFTAGSTVGGPFTVTASSGGTNGTATATVSSTIVVGEPAILATNDRSNGNQLWAQQATLAQPGTLQSLSIYLTTSSGKLRLGVYDATGPAGGPGAKRAETGEITPVTGWNTAGVTAPVSLPAGSYWLAYLPSTNTLQFREASSGSARWYAVTYGALPATFSTAPTSGADHWSFYATLTAGTPNQAPTVATAAAASPSAATGTTTALSVLGADDGGEAALTYTWAATGTPPAAVSFAPNGTNAAKASTATFTRAGTYTLQATVTDAQGLSATSSVSVTVSQTLTSIVVGPATASVTVNGTQPFTATGRDQFAQPLAVAPAFTWAASGGGTISAAGLFTAGSAVGGPFTVTASSGATSGTASVSVTNAAPTVATAAAASPNPATGTTAALSVLGADDGGEAALAYTWAATGTPPAAVSFAPNGANAAKASTVTFAAAGTYTLQATVTDAQGLTATSSVTVTVSQTLTTIVVAPASATVPGSGTQPFAATARDQFAQPLAAAPAFAWAVSGGGTIDATGLFTAGTTGGGPFTVTASGGGTSGTGSVTVAPNAPPTVATAAAGPGPVTGTSAALSVLGADDGGEAALTYTWVATGSPPAAVSFAPNGTNAGKASTATFSRAGTYTLQATVADAQGLTVASSVSVTVDQVLTSVVVAPPTATVTATGTQQFAADGRDQFAQPLAVEPAFSWAVSGGGSIGTDGLFTAGPAAGGPFTVTASSGATSGTASVSVASAPPTVASAAAASPDPVTGTSAALSVLGADDGGEAALTYSWAATGSAPAAVGFAPNGTNAAKASTATFTRAGTYALQATVKDAEGQAVTSSVTVTVGQTLTSVTVTPGSATVTASGTQPFAASGGDQFGQPLTVEPTFTWAVSGGGTIGATGLFTAGGTAGGPFTVTASSAATSGTASVSVTSAPPTVATEAAASPDPVTGTATALSVLGADDGGEAALTYSWAATGTPPAAVSFAPNGTNAAKASTVTFAGAGTYTLQATVRDADALAVTSSATVTVTQTLTSIVVTPSNAAVAGGGTQLFAAAALDQFGRPFTVVPAMTWAVSGGGTIGTSGLFTAGNAAGGPFTVTAVSGGISGTASVSVTNGAPTVASVAAASPNPVTGTTGALSVLGADDGGEAALTYTWSATGSPPAAVSFTPNGTNAAQASTATFTRAGTYSLQATVTDVQGLSATSTVTVSVSQTLASIAVTPGSATVPATGTQPFAATVLDQFGQPFSVAPAVAWAVSGGGTISPSGVFTAGTAAGGPFTVTASGNGSNGTASVRVTISGLDFPGVAGVTKTMRFKFDAPQNNGLPAYGAAGSGVTYIWRAYPRQQNGYYTAFFWGNDDGKGTINGTFLWKNGSADTYYGAHPYPHNGHFGVAHDWEIAAQQDDYLNGAVVYNRWFTQALRVWSDASGKHHEFYWDLPNTDAAHLVSHTSPTSYGNVNPPAPALTWGDAPWNPGQEVFDGVLRGIQIYSGLLSLSDIQAEASAPLSTPAGANSIWYLNINPTPSDISDKSGRGHNPLWIGTERPAPFAN
jgi:hypothetical protein